MLNEPDECDDATRDLETGEFRLQIEFSGLCLFITRKDKRRVTVLMPDARRERSVEVMRHHDGTEAVPHSGYVRFDLGDALPGVFSVAPNNSVGPRNEGIHRFDREELKLNLGDAPRIKTDELEFPDFGKINDRLQVNPRMFDDSPPAELLMRMDLTGGCFTAHSGGCNWTFPDTNLASGPYQGQFANYVTWTRIVKQDTLNVTIAPFGKAGFTFPLHPSENRLIRLKVSNLCAENPLEWPDLALRVIAPNQNEDKDFKWLYRLFVVKGEKEVKDAIPVAVGARPGGNVPLMVPILDRTSGPASIEQDCTGGKGDE